MRFKRKVELGCVFDSVKKTACGCPTHASVQCSLFIMHVHDRFCSQASRFSTYLLAFACTKREYCLCIQILELSFFHECPPYLPIDSINLPFQVNLHVPPPIIQISICFVCSYCSWSGRGWSVSSMLSGLFSC